MAQHPAKNHLDLVSAQWPGVWDLFAKRRADYRTKTPPGMYVRDDTGRRVVADYLRATGGQPITLEDFAALPIMDASNIVVTITTLAAWRMTQGIYRVDPALYDTLITTPLDGDIPAHLLRQLPEWCIYIETPGLHSVLIDDSKAGLRGIFVRRTIDDAGRESLVFSADTPAEHLHSFALPLLGSLDEAISHAVEPAAASNPVAMQLIRHSLVPMINLLLYICTQAGDVTGKNGKPGNPQPKVTRRDGVKLFPASGPAIWDVGVRMGAALRAAYRAEEMGEGREHAGPRPHIRRAHWHGFRSGPIKTPDGKPIPASKRKFDLRWLPPIPVMLTDLDDLPAVIRPVK